MTETITREAEQADPFAGIGEGLTGNAAVALDAIGRMAAVVADTDRAIAEREAAEAEAEADDGPRVQAMVFIPDLDHPYQIARHGGPPKPPPGLCGKDRTEWLRKWKTGTESFRRLAEWSERVAAFEGAEVPGLVAEWRRNRKTLTEAGMTLADPKAAL